MCICGVMGYHGQIQCDIVFNNDLVDVGSPTSLSR